jgi:hypothetical protein
MKYRGFEYTIIQGYERGTWRWSVNLRDGGTKAGNIRGKPEALGKIKRAVDKSNCAEEEGRQSRLKIGFAVLMLWP